MNARTEDMLDRILRTGAAVLFALALASLAACGNTTSAAVDGGPGGDAGPDCVMSPANTHLDIINACTNAQHVDKRPTLPLLNPDGSLPPLP